MGHSSGRKKDSNSEAEDVISNHHNNINECNRSRIKHLEKAASEGIRKMVNYATVPGCRRSKILDHFGQIGGGELCSLKLANRNGTKGCDWCIDNGVVQQRLEDMHQSRMLLCDGGSRGCTTSGGEILFLPPQVKDEVDKWEMEFLGGSESVSDGDPAVDPLGDDDNGLVTTAAAESHVPHYINGLEERWDVLEELEYLNEIGGSDKCSGNSTELRSCHRFEESGCCPLPHYMNTNTGLVSILSYDTLQYNVFKVHHN